MAEIVLSTDSQPGLILDKSEKRKHSELKNLGYEESGHTGFQKELSEEELKAIASVPGKEDKSNKIQSVSDMNGDEEQYFSANTVLNLIINESQTVSQNAIAYTDVKVGEVEERVTTNEQSITGAFGAIQSNESRITNLENDMAGYGEFELIDSGTLAEDVIQIEPDFKGENYKELYFYFKIPTTNADGSNTTKGRFWLLNSDYNSKIGSDVKLWDNQGFVVDNYNTEWQAAGTVKMYGTRCYSQVWFAKYYSTGNELTPYAIVPSGSTFTGGVVPYKQLDNPYLERFVVAFTSQTAGQRYLPAGTTYEFWGVKA